MSEPITRQDLNDILDRKFDEQKEYYKLAHKHINENQEKHETALYGENGRGGLVGDVNTIKTTASNVKWWATAGGLSGISAWIKHVFFN